MHINGDDVASAERELEAMGRRMGGGGEDEGTRVRLFFFPFERFGREGGEDGPPFRDVR